MPGPALLPWPVGEVLGRRVRWRGDRRSSVRVWRQEWVRRLGASVGPESEFA